MIQHNEGEWEIFRAKTFNENEKHIFSRISGVRAAGLFGCTWGGATGAAVLDNVNTNMVNRVTKLVT